MLTKQVAYGLIGVGGVALVLSLAANPLGIGSNPREFGWLQGLGTGIGVVLLLAGIWLLSRQ